MRGSHLAKQLGSHPDTGAGKQCENTRETRPVLNINYAPASSALANISNRLYELKIPSKSLYKSACVRDKVFKYLK